MKKIWVYALSIGIISSSILLGSTLSLRSLADSAPQPGTADDPVVTKSYVDQQIRAALANQPTSTPTPTPSNPGSGASSTIQIIQLEKGHTLWAKSGAEVIVRTGKTVAVSKDTNTIPDVTAGTNIAAGAAVPINHMLVFPNDTRGVKATNANTAACWVMVRGGYTILDANGADVTDK